jgi:hypothetical protein
VPEHEDPQRDRMLRAAGMLRRGEDIVAVAALTGVSVALLELLRTDLAQDTGTHHQQGLAPPERQRRSWPRWRLVVLVVIELVAMANIAAAVTALVRHSTGLGVLSGVVAITLTLIILLLIRIHHSPR